ncbi:MAG: hypothetical protein RL757_3205 [Bacteroidota bacterium]|jgi:agmatinase
MTSKQQKIDAFDPSGIGLKNGNFIGLPFDEDESDVILLPVPWDVTVSYSDGTAMAAQNILHASSQLDLFDPDVPDAWQRGIFVKDVEGDGFAAEKMLHRSRRLRPQAKKYIDFLENGGDLEDSMDMQHILQNINAQSDWVRAWVKARTGALLENGKLVGLIGGEHSIPLGYLEALAEHHEAFGVLQIDAHFDLREAYEGFTFSHASIFFNASKRVKNIEKFVHVGIRDFCEEEVNFVKYSNKRHEVFYDQQIREMQMMGNTFEQICDKIVAALPQKVYISFDIDGLDPTLCPNTGTPVAGGFQYWEAVYLLKKVVASGRVIIGFDLSEVGGDGHEFDGNVGARLLYKLCNLMAFSQKNA